MVSLRVKLTTLIYASVFLTAVAIGGLGIAYLTKVTRQDSQALLNLICIAEKGQLDITMGNIKQTVDSMRDVIFNEVKDDVSLFASDAEFRDAVTHRFESMFYTIAYHTKGAITYYLRYDPDLIADGNQGFLWSKRNRSSSFSKLELTDMSHYDEDDAEHVGWYYIPAKNGKATWLKPYRNQNLGIYMISYVVPIYVQKQLIGVVGMDIDFSIFFDEINQLNIYKGGYAYVSDETHTVVYHKDYDSEEEQPLQGNAVETSSLELNNGWTLFVTAPKSEIARARNHLTALFVVLTLVIAGAFILLATRYTRRIIRPLMELVAATRKIAAGDLNVHIQRRTDDEIGILADAFKKAVEHLPEYMYRDSLTGVRNAAAYKREVEKLEARLQSAPHPFAVCVMDVNNLKQTNDVHGHEAGNQLLINATRFICSIFAHSPVFRIGGDEFVAILEQSDYEKRVPLLQRFDACNGTITFVAAESEATLSVSVARGLAEYNPATDSSYSDVFNRADGSMYVHKKACKARALRS